MKFYIFFKIYSCSQLDQVTTNSHYSQNVTLSKLVEVCRKEPDSKIFLIVLFQNPSDFRKQVRLASEIAEFTNPYIHYESAIISTNIYN